MKAVSAFLLVLAIGSVLSRTKWQVIINELRS